MHTFCLKEKNASDLGSSLLFLQNWGFGYSDPFYKVNDTINSFPSTNFQQIFPKIHTHTNITMK
jgi:hypothetical protein